MQGSKTTRYLILLGVGLALLAGCNGGGPSTRVFVRREGQPRLRVAVLPFASASRDQDSGRVMTDAVITYLLASNLFEVVEPGLVDRAAAEIRFNPQAGQGLDSETLSALQQRLGVDAYIVGQVSEFGEVRIGPETYPNISFTARMVRASDATIVWAARISKTGADTIKVFDLGRVTSLGKLTNMAVAAMAGSLVSARSRISASFAPPAPGETPAALPLAVPAAPTGRFLDESRQYTPEELRALLPEISGMTRDAVDYSKHAFDTVHTFYRRERVATEATLVDYLKSATAARFVEQESAGLAPGKVQQLPAFSGPSGPQTPGYEHLNVQLGRFGLFVRGPDADDLQRVVQAVVAGAR